MSKYVLMKFFMLTFLRSGNNRNHEHHPVLSGSHGRLFQHKELHGQRKVVVVVGNVSGHVADQKRVSHVDCSIFGRWSSQWKKVPINWDKTDNCENIETSKAITCDNAEILKLNKNAATRDVMNDHAPTKAIRNCQKKLNCAYLKLNERQKTNKKLNGGN